MFQENDYIIYGTTGVCQIVDIRKEQFSGSAANEYYVLKPVNANNSTIYAPVGNRDYKMRRVFTVDEIDTLIKEISDEKGTWIIDDQLRKEKFNEIIKKGDRKELVKLIKTLRHKQDEQTENGRKFHIADEEMMKLTEKLLYEEFALVLDIEPEEVGPLILAQTSQMSE